MKRQNLKEAVKSVLLLAAFAALGALYDYNRMYPQLECKQRVNDSLQRELDQFKGYSDTALFTITP